MPTHRASIASAHPGPLPDFLTIQQTAARHNISPRSVRRWIDRYGLPIVQVSPRGRVLIAVSDLQQFLTAHRRPAVSLDRLVEETLSGMVPHTQHHTGGDTLTRRRGVGT